MKHFIKTYSYLLTVTTVIMMHVYFFITYVIKNIYYYKNMLLISIQNKTLAENHYRLYDT